MGNGHEERLFTLVLIQIFKREIRNAVHPVAGKINAVVIFIKHNIFICISCNNIAKANKKETFANYSSGI